MDRLAKVRRLCACDLNIYHLREAVIVIREARYIQACDGLDPGLDEHCLPSGGSESSFLI